LATLRTADEHLAFWQKHLGADASFVYVIQAAPGTPIKVGVAKNPQARMAHLQTGNPAELRLLFVVPGAHDLEADFHHRLADSSVRGEWFAEPGINGFLEWMDEFAAEAIVNYGLTGALPQPKQDDPEPKRKRRDFRSLGWTAKGPGHRWRTGPDEEAPVEVRYVTPDPSTPVAEAREFRAAKKRIREAPWV
jgi:hypothetical protein